MKEEIINISTELLKSKIDRLKTELTLLDKSQNSETKSSMGDKYETSREMMQRERDQLSQNLSNFLKMQDQFLKINFNTNNQFVTVGNLVTTNYGQFLISIALGEIKFNQENIYVISLASPIGKILLGKKINEKFVFAGRNYQILTID